MRQRLGCASLARRHAAGVDPGDATSDQGREDGRLREVSERLGELGREAPSEAWKKVQTGRRDRLAREIEGRLGADRGAQRESGSRITLLTPPAVHEGFLFAHVKVVDDWYWDWWVQAEFYVVVPQGFATHPGWRRP